MLPQEAHALKNNPSPSGCIRLSENQPVLGTLPIKPHPFIRKSACFGDKYRHAPSVYTKIRLFWGQSPSSPIRLSENPPVLGTLPDTPHLFIRKSACFGDTSRQAPSFHPKIRLFWGHFPSSPILSSENPPVLGTLPATPHPLIRFNFIIFYLHCLQILPHHELLFFIAQQCCRVISCSKQSALSFSPCAAHSSNFTLRT